MSIGERVSPVSIIEKAGSSGASSSSSHESVQGKPSSSDEAFEVRSGGVMRMVPTTARPTRGRVGASGATAIDDDEGNRGLISSMRGAGERCSTACVAGAGAMVAGTMSAAAHVSNLAHSGRMIGKGSSAPRLSPKGKSDESQAPSRRGSRLGSFSARVHRVVDAVEDAVEGVVDAVEEAVEGVVDAVEEAVEGVVDAVEETSSICCTSRSGASR
jgi:hypothetical protein